MWGKPRRPPCWLDPQLLPGFVFLIYSWLLIFSSLLGYSEGNGDGVSNYNNSSSATATQLAISSASKCFKAAATHRCGHSNSSLNGPELTPTPGIAVSLSLNLEQELGSNPFVKLQPPRVSLSLSLSVFGEMKASPFGFVIKLPLPQPEPEPPVGEGQEHLPKQGASDQQPQHPNLGISSSSSGWRQCSYTVTIKTSCSSPRITRDAISLAFGDAYRHEVYAARLDDPASGTFERCSIDTFRVTGPCGDRTCYLYLRRSGRDGWTPEYVKIFYIPGDTRSAVTFYYKVPLPYGVWYGFNLCHGGGGATIPSTVFKLFQGTEETGNDVGRKDTDSEVMYETEMERSN